ncbi:hypothetical protein EDD21DRAFT_445042, partial [Dissophora ornata]
YPLSPTPRLSFYTPHRRSDHEVHAHRPHRLRYGRIRGLRPEPSSLHGVPPKRSSSPPSLRRSHPNSWHRLVCVCRLPLLILERFLDQLLQWCGSVWLVRDELPDSLCGRDPGSGTELHQWSVFVHSFIRI